VRSAIFGAVVLEGWADSIENAQRLVAAGKVTFEPCNHHGAVGPMAGIISPSMPLFVVENKTAGNRAFSNMNEGLGKVLRFGANNAEVVARLRWMANVVAPTLRAALGRSGPIELKPSTANIKVPLVGSTITPIVVFLPLITITGVTGTFFRAPKRPAKIMNANPITPNVKPRAVPPIDFPEDEPVDVGTR